MVLAMTTALSLSAGLPRQLSTGLPTHLALLAAVLLGLLLLLLPLLPGAVAAGAGRGSAPSQRGPDGGTGVRLLIVLMSSSDGLGWTQM